MGAVPIGAVPPAVEFSAAELVLYRPLRLSPEMLTSNGVEVLVVFGLGEGVMLGAEVIFAEGRMMPVPPVAETMVVPPVTEKLAAPEIRRFDGVTVAFEDGTMVPEGIVMLAVGVIAPDPPVEMITAVPPDSETLKPPAVGNDPVVSFADGVTVAEAEVAFMDGDTTPVPPEEYVMAVAPEAEAINDPLVGVDTLPVGPGVGIAILKSEIKCDVFVSDPVPPVENTAEVLPEMLPLKAPEVAGAGVGDISPVPPDEYNMVVPALTMAPYPPEVGEEESVRFAVLVADGRVPTKVVEGIIDPPPPVEFSSKVPPETVPTKVPEVPVGMSDPPPPVEFKVNIAPETVPTNEPDKTDATAEVTFKDGVEATDGSSDPLPPVL